MNRLLITIIAIIILFSYCTSKYERSIEKLNSANELASNGKLKEALPIYNEIIEKNESFVSAYAKRAALLRLMGNYGSALDDINKAIELEPDSSSYYVIRGSIKENLNDLKGSIQDYNQAVTIDNSYLAHNNLGMLKMKMNNFPDAMISFNKSIEFNPVFSLTYNNRGTLKERMGDSQGAIEDYGNAIKLDSTVDYYYYNRFVSRYTIEEWEGAIEDLNRAIEISPDYSEYYYYRGLVYVEMDSLTRGCKEFEKAAIRGSKAAQKEMLELCHKDSI